MIFNFFYFCIKRDVYTGPLGSVFSNDPEDRRSIPGRVIPKALEMILYISLLNTQYYKVRIKGKVGQYKKGSNFFYLHPTDVAIEKSNFGVTIPYRTPVTSTSSNHFTSWPVIN